MYHKLSTTVNAETGCDEIRVQVAGCLTQDTQLALHPVLRRTRHASPARPLVVDLTDAQHLEAPGVELLYAWAQAMKADMGTVRLLLPETLPVCPLEQEGATIVTDSRKATAEHSARGGESTRSHAPARTARSEHVADPVDAALERTAAHHARHTRREEILDGAAALFAEYGFYGASLRDISRRVGISHPGMLHHFASKNDLLGGVIDRLEAHAQSALDRVEEFSASPQALMKALAEVWNPASPELQLMATLDTDATSEDHPGHFRMARLRRVHEHVLETCFEAMAKQGHLREDVEPDFASRALLALALRHAVRERTVRTMQSEDHDDAPGKDLRHLAETFLHV